MDEGTVKGVVSIDGKPLTGGKVVFNPANAQRKFVPVHEAEIGKDGSYSVTTLVGTNTISVQAIDTKKMPDLAYQSSSFDVARGENHFDVSLKGAGKGRQP
jgi:hypothetical protein